MSQRWSELLRRAYSRLPAAWRVAAHRVRGRWQAAATQRRFQRQLRDRAPLRIVVGSSGMIPPGWIGTEVEFLNLLQPADWARYFQPASVEAILAEHVWEHLTLEEGAVAARTCHQFLQVGGYLRVAVPDGLNPNPDYRDRVRIGGSGAGADDHRVLYDHRTLGALLTGAGFTVDLLEYFDADGNFHAKAWDPAAGLIRRSRAFDTRNADGKLRYTSLIIDAFKAPAPSR